MLGEFVIFQFDYWGTSSWTPPGRTRRGPRPNGPGASRLPGSAAGADLAVVVVVGRHDDALAGRIDGHRDLRDRVQRRALVREDRLDRGLNLVHGLSDRDPLGCDGGGRGGHLHHQVVEGPAGQGHRDGALQGVAVLPCAAGHVGSGPGGRGRDGRGGPGGRGQPTREQRGPAVTLRGVAAESRQGREDRGPDHCGGQVQHVIPFGVNGLCGAGPAVRRNAPTLSSPDL